MLTVDVEIQRAWQAVGWTVGPQLFTTTVMRLEQYVGNKCRV